MSISLLTVTVLHERRIRLSFSTALGSGAFVTSLYVVTNLDGLATNPNITEAFIVSGSVNVVELAFDTDLCAGALYKVTAVGVPATDLSVTPAGTAEPFRSGAAFIKKTVEASIRDREALLYSVDIIWNGADYQETMSGDLARVGGKQNVTKALWRSVESRGLPWDPNWGIDAREYVDSPSSQAAPLTGALSAQIMKDPRVIGIRSNIQIEDTKTTIYLIPTLVGNDKVEPVSVTVPNA